MVTTHHNFNLVGLARVSTVIQDAQLQRDALMAAGCGRTRSPSICSPNAPALVQFRDGRLTLSCMTIPDRITDGPERPLLENMLNRSRAALIDTVRGLSDEDARRRLVASLTTPISLLKHAAAAERIWFQRFWAGLDESECGGYSNRDEDTFTVADDESLADVIVEFERASQRSRVIASRFDLDDTKNNPREGKVSMRRTLLAMIEEFARHAGHGDILVEQINDMHQEMSSRRRAQRK